MLWLLRTIHRQSADTSSAETTKIGASDLNSPRKQIFAKTGNARNLAHFPVCMNSKVEENANVRNCD